MYTLKEAFTIMGNGSPVKDWEGIIYCTEANGSATMLTNKTQGFMAAYIFNLVTKGSMKILYRGKEVTFGPDDLYVCSPGFPINVLETSEDFKGICLLADEHATLEMPAVHDLVHLGYMPIVQRNEPKLALPHEDALRLKEKMMIIYNYLRLEHIFKKNILYKMYEVFLLDMQDMQKRITDLHPLPQRMEDIYIEFARLLPKHFIEHHDIGFYADALNISTVYFSRIVRQVSGHTVMEHINNTRIMEASFLLRTSTMSIAQIADYLNFADAATFTKFFSRIKGMTPKAFREEKEKEGL